MIADNAVIEGRPRRGERAEAGWGKCRSQEDTGEQPVQRRELASGPLCGGSGAAAGPDHGGVAGRRRAEKAWSTLVR